MKYLFSSRLHKACLIAAAACLFISSAEFSFAQPQSRDAVASDPMLKAMQAELDREKALLVLPQRSHP